MRKKALTRITTAVVAVIMLVAILLSVTMSVFGNGSVYDPSFMKQGQLNFDPSKYFDGSVVYQLPSGVKDDDEISVIVQLGNEALLDAYNKTDKEITFSEFVYTKEAEAIKQEIASEKNSILATLKEKEIAYKAGADYSAVMSGFEIVITAKDFKDVCLSLGDGASAILGEVYKVAETELVENKVNVYETGIFNSAGYKYDGSGMVVAVLDTGLDYTHSAFSVNNFTSNKLGLNKADVAKLIASTKASTLVEGLGVDDVFVNNKVPFSFDYADNDSDVYSLHNNHGTHVSGVIVGKDDTITGVAPNAQLVSMKIFSDTQDSARSAWILSALEDCVILGVDVINMSLGTACGFSRESDEEKITGVYDKIRAQGISLIVAASNSFSSAYGSEKNGNLGLTSNPDTSTVGSPSTYEGAMSVASISGVKTPYLLYNGKIVYFLESTDSSTEEKKFVEEILPEGVTEKEFEYVVIPGVGREADYAGIDIKGKIALVRRGSNTFEEKANAALASGAIGLIVYNNISGDIRMNVGTTKLPVISISQVDGEELAKAGNGKIKISTEQSSGPFMSDFSSWGPSPSLGIKPEITAHGGNILSSVTGGGYDRLSGTSMACPNLAGVVILLRQHVMDKYPNIKNDPVKVNALVNNLLMSTADIIFNKNGLPYAVRKQGAGLANLVSATNTPAYILTYNREDNSVMDKTKIELGDDPTKSGVYTLNFSVVNTGNESLTYALGAYVMTEGVSDVKTHKGDTTVTEEGYILDGAEITFEVTNATKDGDEIIVEAGKSANVKVTIKLTDENKKYLDTSFANGMYVEGFVTLKAESGTDIDLNVPYLAFYGDWAQAPMLDLDYFETNKDELNDSIETLDKTLPDAYATRPIGGIYDDYVSYLGSYYFMQNPNNKVISANRDYIALSNQEGTVHSLRFVWAGMLRNASKIEISITDDATGEVIFTCVDEDVRKSYGDGGSYLYPANVEIEFDTQDYNLKNNTEYTVKLVGYLDYEDGGLDSNLKNTFKFPLVADFEAPSVTDCEFYTEYDSDLDKTRLFVRLAVYDNHYSMGMQIGYISNEKEFLPFETYMVPIYSERNGTTYVEYEITDFIYDIKNNSFENDFSGKHMFNSIAVVAYDYALNLATYEIGLPDEFQRFYFESTEITLSKNEVHTLKPLAYPSTEWPELLQFTSSNTNVAKVVNNKVIAIAKGMAEITAKDPRTGQEEKMTITVLDQGDEGWVEYDKPIADVFKVTQYTTLKAYFILDNNEREIGTTGDVTIFGSGKGYHLTLYPSESVDLDYKLDAYFPGTKVTFESGDEDIVTVDENGVVVAKGEGSSVIMVTVSLEDSYETLSQAISVEVKDPFVTTAPQLTHYYGNGGFVEIPKELLLTEIGQFAFSNFDYVMKTPEELLEDDQSLTKMAPIGDNTITKVVIPEGVKKIGPYAFAKLTALKEVVLPSTLEAIEYNAFEGCTALKTVKGLENVKLINSSAFYNCNLTGTISLDSACAVGDFAFAGNKKLEGVVVSSTLQSIGGYAFANDEALKNVTVNAEIVKYGPYVFSGCTSLEKITMNANVIPEGAFYGATKLSDVTIGKDVTSIGEFAFAGTKVSEFKLEKGNTAYKVSADKKYLVTSDGKTLVLVVPTYTGEFKLADKNITTIGKGAFIDNAEITLIEIPSVTKVEAYAFAYCDNLTSVKLGELDYIGEYAYFDSAITELPSLNKIKSISKYAFGFTDITSVQIANGVVIAEGAFCECAKLASIVIGDDVVIGDSAFMLSRNNNSQLVLDETSPVDKFYYYDYTSALTSLKIGKNVVIGSSAFMGASKLTVLELGEGAKIGDKAFFSACSLESVDLSKVISIGEDAFSGDVGYTYLNVDRTVIRTDDEGYPIYYYYTPKLEVIDLSSLESIGNTAFRYCLSLKEVKFGDKLEKISNEAFYYCTSLEKVDFGAVNKIGESVFALSALKKIDLSSVIEIGKYAFVESYELEEVTLNQNGTSVIGEGAFGYCKKLSKVNNLNKVQNFDAYAFAYTEITSANLEEAVSIGDHVFMKENLTDFDIKLGNKLVALGDNPFANCKLQPFFIEEKETFRDEVVNTIKIYTYDISDTVHVIDGSLYCEVPRGLELIAYAGIDPTNVIVADNTVRVTAYAFAGSDVVRVTLPHTLRGVGHMAFIDCDKLQMVAFKSFFAPNLEEEFDPTYYDTYENFAGTGDFVIEFTNGYKVESDGLGIVPYYMWNLTDTTYSNVFYGANFVNRIGHGNPELLMIRPVNGKYYDSFIYDQYFGMTFDGIVAPDDITMAAIDAINKIPDMASLTLEHKPLVEAARAAYNKIATYDQMALVTNYQKLIDAEGVMLALEGEKPTEPTPEEPFDPTPLLITLVVVLGVMVVGGTVCAIFAVRYVLKRKKLTLGQAIKKVFSKIFKKKKKQEVNE
ncbi:MAG: leucine-rich repeat protein [Clostridia bacterium]|nr:leucine-rich repeat protein [Clostridia bacterium]MBO5092047.1 leucine-rich repeat protein [Clostridia bacterium]MBP3494637.1 leucine-rich repeat protein [Clostridia bacterium]